MINVYKKIKPYLGKLQGNKYPVAAIVIIIVAGVGITLSLRSNAQSPYVSVEASLGTLTSPATIGYSSDAYNGQYVQFGGQSTQAASPLLLGFYAGGDYAAFPWTTTGIPAGCTTNCHYADAGMPDTYMWGTNDALVSTYTGGGWGQFAGNYGVLDTIDTAASGAETYSPVGITDEPNPPTDVYRAVIGIWLLSGNSGTQITSDNPQIDGLTQGTASDPDTNPADYVNSDTMSLADCALTNSQYPDGPYATYYEQEAQEMAKDGFKSPIIRLNWEMNGGWDGLNSANGVFNPSMPYGQDFQAFEGCWQNAVKAFRAGWAEYGAGDGNLMFDFNPSAGYSGAGDEVNIPKSGPFSDNPNVGCSTDPSSQYYNSGGCQQIWIPLNWASFYPGDQYVDIIGLDSYDDTNPAYCSIDTSQCPGTNWLYDNTCVSQSNPTDAYSNPVTCTAAQQAQQLTNEEQGWTNLIGTAGTAANGFTDGNNGLAEQVAFAKAHSKLMSVPEWGVDIGDSDGGNHGGDDPYYINQMAGWLTNQNNVNGYENYYYASYFNAQDLNGSGQGVPADGAIDFVITDGHFPNALKAMETDFKPYAADRDPNAPNG